MGDEVRFAADCMLGTLAKWLRILGYDTAYESELDDAQIARRARTEGRVLLSRDRVLVRRKGLLSLLVESEVLENQILQVLEAYRLKADKPFSRCPVCNVLLEDVPRSDAWGQVPPFVSATQERFSLCPECNHFYWHGTHWQRMVERIRSLQG
jgi:uncharacterized protein with PIN domain